MDGHHVDRARRLVRHMWATTQTRVGDQPRASPDHHGNHDHVPAKGEPVPGRAELLGEADGAVGRIVPERRPHVPEHLVDEHQRQSVQDPEDKKSMKDLPLWRTTATASQTANGVNARR
jgi:hypothetical protein